MESFLFTNTILHILDQSYAAAPTRSGRTGQPALSIEGRPQEGSCAAFKKGAKGLGGG